MSGRTALVERDGALTELHTALGRARSGRGELVLVTGEAGVGKSSVIAAFLDQAAGPPVVWRGACDPMAAPRPFGPLVDAVRSSDRDLAHRLAMGATRAEAFAAALALLDPGPSGRPAVMVIEDAHWADEATLDLLTFLGRRVADFPALLVVTFRDDEVGPQHQLRIRLGDLGAAIRCRVHLRPLTLDAVRALTTASELDPDELHRLTAGNPFFVTEVLAAGAPVMPESVRDAVLARASRLGPEARRVLDAASIAPGRAEPRLLASLVAPVDESVGLDECSSRGLLVVADDGTVSFRHELARLAVLDALSVSQRRELHARALAALTPDGEQVDRARLALHAIGAGDVAAVVDHAPAAAALAAAVGAHHEAARHLDEALRHRDQVRPELRATLLVRLGDALSTLGRHLEGLAAYDEAAELRASLGDLDGQVEALVHSGRPLVSLGRNAESLERLTRAQTAVTGVDLPLAEARIEASLASMHMLARQFDLSERHGRRAMALAAEIGDDVILAEVCVQSGIALAMAGDDAGLSRIRRGIELASNLGQDRLVALGHLQVGSGYGELRRYDVAVPALRDGVEFAEAREMVSSVHYMRAWWSRCEFELGQWDHAAELAGALSRNPRCTGISRFVVLLVIGWLRARRGDPDPSTPLDEALQLALASEHVQRLWPVAVCRAEVAWLSGRLDAELELVERARQVAAGLHYRIAVEELDHWLDVGRGSVEPFADIDRWQRLGCPYELAMARFATGDVAERRFALATFERLGAAPMRDRTMAALRDAGVSVRRGPTTATRRNPSGLTDREVAVLTLMAAGSTNRQIAVQLGISAKTVGHHVANVFAKLDVHSRVDAARAAERLGLVPA